ncbi:MAG TPA: hypothetical protein VKA15_04830, partial [Isosphaeraceae bacterium]|nr:hypothetical protein [Isosphaeraceae bacterium]
GEPAPGENGFLIGSMVRFIPDYNQLYKVFAITWYKSLYLENWSAPHKLDRCIMGIQKGTMN